MKFFFAIPLILFCSFLSNFSHISELDLMNTRKKLRDSGLEKIIFQKVLQEMRHKNVTSALKKTKTQERYFYENSDLAKRYKNIFATSHMLKQITIIHNMLDTIKKYTTKSKWPNQITDYGNNDFEIILYKYWNNQFQELEKKMHDLQILIGSEKKDLSSFIKENYCD